MTVPAEVRGTGARRWLPRWVRDYERDWLARDVVGGLTVAVLLVPQSLAYAALAGMPPITGLYAALAGLTVYALVGTSSHLSYGPVAIIGLLTASALGPLGDGDPVRAVALAAALALLVGAIHLGLGLLGAGAIVDLISHPVIVGFTAAAGLIIGLSQARDLLRLDVARSERFVEAVAAVGQGIGTLHVPTAVIGVAAVVVLLVGRRLAPRFPTVIAVAAIAVVASVTLDLPGRGVPVVADVPAGLPVPLVPRVSLADLRALLPIAVVIALVSFAESFSIGKAIAARSRETLDADRELVASGIANAAAGLAGGLPVAGSFTRSFLTFQARARTQLAGVVAAGVVVLTLVLLTGLLEPLPRAVLAAIVVVTVVGLVDVRAARHIWAADRRDFLVLAATFVATLVLGVELGLAFGVGASLVVHVASGMRPALVEMGRVEGTTHYRNTARYPTVTDPRGVIVRLDGAIDFLSARSVTAEFARLVAERPELDWIVVDGVGITGLDTTGLAALDELRRDLHDAGVELRLVALRGPQRDLIERAGLGDELVEARMHRSVPAALRALGYADDDRLIAPSPDEVAPDRLF